MALLPVADALAKIIEHAAPLPAEQVPLVTAHRRVLAQDIVALRTQPPDDVSAMDGYAVRAADIESIPARLQVVGEVAAGHPFAGNVGHGQAARIFTGGVLPGGADAIVIQEDVDRDGIWITVKETSPKGKHIRVAGLDFKQGQTLLQKGRFLSGRDLTLAAAMNYPQLAVSKRPKVAILATGDELVMPGQQPGPGQIVYSNGYSVEALVREEGADVINLGIARDRLDDTVAAIRRARDLDVDVLITTGGASVGDHDLVHKALTAEGAALSFWKVAVRPGKPLMYGRAGSMHVLGVPGNPVSAFVCTLLFGVPLIRKLMDRSDIEIETESARLGAPLNANDQRQDYLRATLSPAQDGGVAIAIAVPSQDSSLMAPLAHANCLIIRPPFAPASRAGEPCRIVKLPF